MKFKLDTELIKKYVYFLVAVLALLLCYKIFDNFAAIIKIVTNGFGTIFNLLFPILLGVVLAYFLFRPMRGIEKFIFKMIPISKKYPKAIRLISILVIYIITIVLIILFFYATIPSVIESLTKLAYRLPQNLAQIDEFLGQTLANDNGSQEIVFEIKSALESFQNMTSWDIINQIATYLGANPESIQEISTVAFVFVKGTVGFIISFFVVFFIGLYLMLDKEKLIEQVDRFAKAVMNKIIYNGSHWAIITIDGIFYKYFAGKILTSMLIGFLCYLGLLVIGVNYAPLIAIIVGVTNVIPYFGPIIGAIPGLLLTLMDDPVKALWFSLWIIIVQQFDGNVLAPNVLGKIVELNPFWVLVSVVVGGSVFGMVGMFVAIPMFAVIKVFFEEILTRWESYKNEQALREKNKELESQ